MPGGQGSSGRVHLYLGAHKTATTFVQQFLAARRDALAAGGVALATPQDLREAWLPGFFALQRQLRTGGVPDAGAAEALRRQRPECRTWIVAEENLAGVPRHLLEQPGLYGGIGQALRTMRAIFPDRDIRLFFSIRSYDGFFRSTYAEIVRNRGFLPWGEFSEAVRRHERSWMQPVERAAEALGPENLTLWRYEDFGAVFPDLVAGITGLDGLAETAREFRAPPTRPSLSAETIALLERLVPALGAAECLRLTERIDAWYSVASGSAPFQPFDAAAIAELQARYDRTVAEIRARYPEIAFLGPR